MNFIKQIFIPHSRNAYRPHLIRRHGLAFALLLVVGSHVITGLQTTAQPSVLGYATNVTISGLLAETNSERVAAGKKSLSLNSKLNTAAQGKANHMIAGDYWAHNSPDGVTPWYWFDNAGYQYLVAGENLAYGFDTSSGVVTGWMNSPSHRDNMLNGTFEEVGFGIANGSDFQGSQNTVVVAHYADPAVLSETTVSEPTPPKPKPAASTQQVEAAPAAPEPEEPVVETPPKEEPVAQDTVIEITETTPQPTETALTQTQITSEESQRITNFDALLNGSAPLSLYVAAAVALSLGFVYLYRHVLFIHKSIVAGEKYLIHHPMLEASIIYALVWLLLTSSFGNIL